ncbi:hypothetical protein IE53DRAFT_388538 [Violaceomyces palustris]|uniref:Uncharacterized protein n=1 Tax=Violaceomyces palustris TaxID=1673888 RepID=A0ACD0NTY8_9BASI|nr:hypothetical protein IE53DRAFT_388538 [Violaceomyces palustris]
MSSSKYSNLPDIDTQPDVYETKDSDEEVEGGARRRGGRSRSKVGKKGGSSLRRRNRVGEQGETASDLEASGSDDDDEQSSGEEEDEKDRKQIQQKQAKVDDIDTTSLDALQATNRFQGACEVDGDRVDFSDKLKERGEGRSKDAKRANRGAYRNDRGYFDSGFETTTYEIDGSRQQGRPLERLRRLKFEIGLLEEEIAAAASSSSTSTSILVVDQDEDQDDKSKAKGGEGHQEGEVQPKVPRSERAKTKDEVPVFEMLEQLKSLRSDLGRLDREISSGGGGGGGGEIAFQQGLNPRKGLDPESRKILKKLVSGGRVEGEEKGDKALEGQGPQASSADDAHPAAVDLVHPSKVNDSKRLASIDKRLSELEKVVGAKDVLVDEETAMPKPLLPTLTRIEQQLSLLTQPRHLDAISRRVKVLVTELERVQESRSKLGPNGGGGGGGGGGVNKLEEVGSSNQPKEAEVTTAGLDPETVKRLNKLSQINQRLEPHLNLIPFVLERMRSLSDLHSSSDDFSKRLADLERRQQRSSNEVEQELQPLVRGLEQGLESNQRTMAANLEVLNQRIEALGERIQKLG